MKTLFKQAFNAILNDEIMEQCIEAIDLFQYCLNEGVMEQLQMVIERNTQDTINDGYAMRGLEVVERGLIDMLSYYGVETEADMEYNLILARTLSTIDSYNTPPEIHDLLNSSYSNEQILAELVDWLWQIPVAHSLERIVKVNDTTIEDLITLIGADYEYNELPTTEPVQIKERVGRINNLLRKDRLELINELTYERIRPGVLDVEGLVYNNSYLLNEYKTDVLIKEIYGLVLYSTTALDKLSVVTRTYVEDFVDDPLLLRPFDRIIFDLETKSKS